MSARDDLVQLLTTTQIATDFYGDDAALLPGPAERLADAILAGGWVPRERLGLVRDSVRDVSSQRAAAINRALALCDEWASAVDEPTAQAYAADLRAALDPSP